MFGDYTVGYIAEVINNLNPELNADRPELRVTILIPRKGKCKRNAELRGGFGIDSQSNTI